MVGVDGMAGMEGTVGTMVVSESSPWGELLETVLSLSVSELQLILMARELLENVVAAQ